MEKLLQWSIAQQSGDKEAIAKMGAPDPKALEQIFGMGGPDEPTLMKQAILVAENPEATLENKEIALENYEMLIENLDNANNIENMKQWPSIVKLLGSQDTSLRVYAASIIGIAVQNNPQSQEAFLKQEGGLSKLISVASPNSNEPKELYLKALFAISSIIRNDQPAYTEFNKLQGWKIVSPLAASDTKVKQRILSVLSSILSTGITDMEKQSNFHQIKIVDQMVSILEKDTHAGCIDKVLNIISTLHQNGFKFTNEELAGLSSGLQKVESLKDQLSEEDLENAKKVLA